MTSSPSLAGRALLAIALLVGFYLLALVVIAALLAIPFLEQSLLGRLTGKLTIFAVMAAGAIFWAILPRRDRFADPGPRLEPEEHPRLFETLRATARATGQTMPSDVFLVAQLNAWVSERGGILGFGSRRVMGLGLPLLEALTVSQLRAVLAHEFGHYHGGDTKLGPWIYKTRAALERTLAGLQQHGSFLSRPFEWYGRTFVRITYGISRQQEYTADALAARTVGARPLTEGLEVLQAASDAYDTFWGEELVPALERGVRPPIARGFRHFLGAPKISVAMADSVERAFAEGESGAWDTHPCLRDRVAALAGLPPGDAPTSEPPALSLLRDVDGLERRLLEFLGGDGAPLLTPATWEEVGERVWMAFWRERAAANSAGLAGLTPADLPSHAADLGPLAVRLGLATTREEAAEEHARGAAWVIATALAVILRERGWSLRAMPGEDVIFTDGKSAVRPFSLMHDLETGALAPSDWLAICLRGGIGDLDLGTATGSGSGAGPERALRRWSFVAMEYYALVLNRTYRVIVTDRTICGAKVRGLISAPLFPGDAWQDPDFYPSSKLESRFRGVDPEGPEFLQLDSANFRIERAALTRAELSTRPKWGMGSVPYSGRLMLHLRDGTSRDLVLVGRQDGARIAELLAPRA